MKKKFHVSSVSNIASAVLDDLNKTSFCLALTKCVRFKLQSTKVTVSSPALMNRLLYKFELLNEVFWILAPSKLAFTISEPSKRQLVSSLPAKDTN